MIRHLLKIIWNERKTNGWIVGEYIVVFCILWFCCEYLCFHARTSAEPLGFDVENTYSIQIGRHATENEEDIDELALAQLFMGRVKKYPGVESICMAAQGAPYGGGVSTSSYRFGPDSVTISARVRWVTTEYFDVYKIRFTSGRPFHSDDQAETNYAVITPDRYGLFRVLGQDEPAFKASDIREFWGNAEEFTFIVSGVAEPMKDAYYEPYWASIFFPIKRDELSLYRYQIIMRVSPNVEKDFAERFTRDMREQLNIGPYFLTSVKSSAEMKEEIMQWEGVIDNLNNVYAITAFLVINIFLGVIGTFWYRTQSRRSEIGLRISMGASRKKVRSLLFMETLLLLFVASIVAVNICVNIAQTDLLKTIDMPVSERALMGIGVEQDFLNYGLTFLFLAAISLLAVWYPTRQASNVPPAEALREE